MPGGSARAHQKARGLAPDVLIFDLEDATAPETKEIARDQVLRSLAQGGYAGKEVAVRINGLDTPWGIDDIKALKATSFDALVLPKVETVEAIARLDARLCELAFPTDLRVWAMIETPLGILHLEAIAQSSDRLDCLVMGTSDLTRSLHARHRSDRLPMLHALSQCVTVGRAFDLAVLDGVHLDIADESGFKATCEQGRDLGFDGRTLIHPRQVDICNDTYGPSHREVTEAREIIKAYETGRADGRGVATHNGRLIEQLHAQEAARLLAIADQLDAKTSRSEGTHHE